MVGVIHNIALSRWFIHRGVVRLPRCVVRMKNLRLADHSSGMNRPKLIAKLSPARPPESVTRTQSWRQTSTPLLRSAPVAGGLLAACLLLGAALPSAVASEVRSVRAAPVSLSAATGGLAQTPIDPRTRRPRQLPLPGAAMTRGFQIGEKNWLPGHRGVDLAGQPDQPVLAAAAGSVRWIGVINGVPGLSIQHADGAITTYQPVNATVNRGAPVEVGDPIGLLAAGHPGCTAAACLHWGVRVGKKYLDPMLWLGGDAIKVRLLPVGSRPKSFTPPADDELAADEPGP